jgi:hypothetical protein
MRPSMAKALASLGRLRARLRGYRQRGHPRSPPSAGERMPRPVTRGRMLMRFRISAAAATASAHSALDETPHNWVAHDREGQAVGAQGRQMEHAMRFGLGVAFWQKP